MPILETFGQSGNPLLGFGLVIVFLLALVILKLSNKESTASSGSNARTQGAVSAGASIVHTSQDSGVVAAVAAAVNEYRKNNA